MHMKLDLEDRNVTQLELTVDECRNFDSEVATKVEEALDEPQAFVFTDEGTVAYLLITVRK